MEPSIYPHQTKINSWVLGRHQPSSDSGGNQFCSFCSLDLNRLTTRLLAVMFHNEVNTDCTAYTLRLKPYFQCDALFAISYEMQRVVLC